MCWLTARGRAEIAWVRLRAPFAIGRGCEAVFDQRLKRFFDAHARGAKWYFARLLQAEQQVFLDTAPACRNGVFQKLFSTRIAVQQIDLGYPRGRAMLPESANILGLGMANNR